MYPLLILVAWFSSLVALAAGHEESSVNTCTTTATVSVTTDISPSIAARSSGVPALSLTAPETPTHVPLSSASLDFISSFEPGPMSIFSGSLPSISVPSPTTTRSLAVFTSIPLSSATAALTSPTSLTTIPASNNTTSSTTSTKTSTSSASSTTTQTTSSGTSTTTAAANTSPATQPANAATVLPGGSAILALAVVAGVMLLPRLQANGLPQLTAWYKQ
ncbi:MAG: hypothetical protein Q9209_004707 [Squamulea sp. 1 TL-2023]